MSKERSTEAEHDGGVPDEAAAPMENAGEAAGRRDAAEELQARARQLEEENASLKDQLLRALADSENFRKRMFREREEAVRFANSSLLSDLIGVIDDFERAIQSAESSRDFDSFHAGVSMIERQLVSMLERNWGLQRFQSVGEEFDPQKHQAIMAVPVSGQARTMVLEDFQKGYRLHDRVLRPAKVKVGQPAPQEAGPPGGTDASGQKGDSSETDEQ